MHTGLGIGKGNSLGAVCSRGALLEDVKCRKASLLLRVEKILFSPSSCASHQILLARRPWPGLGPIRQNRTDKTEQKLPPSDKGPHWLFSSSLHLATWPPGLLDQAADVMLYFRGQSPNLKACLLYRIVSWSSYNCPFRWSSVQSWIPNT